jgi:hypothetical protein
VNGCAKADGSAVSFFNFSVTRSLFLSGALCCLPFSNACASGQGATAPAAASTLLSGWHPFAEARAWAASDALPITEFDSDWSRGFAPKDGRNTMLMRNRAEIGVEKDQWRLGWEYRQEKTLVTDRQTLELVRLYKQRLTPSGPTLTALDVRYDAWSAQGPRLGRWFGPAAGAGWLPRVNLSGAVYTGAVLRETAVSGTVGYAPGDQYDFNAGRTETNSRYRYPFMQHTPGASGASVSMAMEWRPSDAFALGLKIDDLWSSMRWRNLPRKEEQINSAVTEYDQQGYVNYSPLLNGTNRQVSGNGALARSGAASASYDFGRLSVATRIERIAGVTIPTLALGHRFGWGKLTTSVETRFRTIGVGVETEHFHMALQADSLRLGQAKAFGLSLGARY